ncbi:lasso peptide biosynthesis B2 protein [Microseira wollei]|uniref:Microcin J25-processing protein McjB C-terminal domain-containing protein n=1 Tax=Microseira wollei NIES-4236 TaxID=2530354 RepID=A0AAV3XUG4_9CYAN|nr:lasso peptide biosynthesis B2 protein [Microseira wollei]GET44187.1 hypothetical protein MiSe_90130 [Microseira wollei NIES-4236]
MKSQVFVSSRYEEIKISLLDRIAGQLLVLLAYLLIGFLPLSTISKIISVFKSRCGREIYEEEAKVAWKAVRQLGIASLGRVACLELSLAFMLFALTRRLSATWCVGVSINPFAAHAWVEINGIPFKEQDEIEHLYKKILVV